MNEKGDKLSTSVRRYFKNLLMAVCGSDPFRAELDDMIVWYEKAAVNVKALNDSYYQLRDKLDAAEKWVTEYQDLVEHLRGRLKEKDAQIAQMEKAYSAELEKLRTAGAKARPAEGKVKKGRK